MGHFALGVKAFFRVWTDDAFASQVGKWLGEHPAGTAAAASAPPPPAPALQPAELLPRQPRSPHAVTTPNIKLHAASAGAAGAAHASPHEALSLLAVLQRDARLVDFLKESIAGYSDAQVGAAVRTVHRQAGAVIERIFGVTPLTAQAEGSSVEIAAGYDPAKVRLRGAAPGGPGPWHGTVVHPGWKAVRNDVPAWNGKGDAAYVLAPTEVEF